MQPEQLKPGIEYWLATEGEVQSAKFQCVVTGREEVVSPQYIFLREGHRKIWPFLVDSVELMEVHLTKEEAYASVGEWHGRKYKEYMGNLPLDKQ